MYKFKEHFKTITEHKIMVMKYCFRVGLYTNGILHDLSKYSPAEFIPGAKYYSGTHSPNATQRDVEGYSSAWIHHKGINKHHYEHWIDVTRDYEKGELPIKMPLRYAVEMFCDRVAACRVYQKDKYTDASALEYYNKNKNIIKIHPQTRALLEYLLKMLKKKGEDYTLDFIKNTLLKHNNYRFNNVEDY